MKKLFSQNKYKRQQKIRIENEIRRGKSKRSKKTIPRPTRKSKRFFRRQRKNVIVPNNFSITNNPEETIACFSRLQEIIQKDRRIYLDLTKISDLTLDALLYMIKIFDKYTVEKRRFDIKGDAPENEYCRDMFINSGFYDYVNHRGPQIRKNNESIKIRSGEDISPSIAKEVIDFSLKHLNQQKSDKSKAIYRSIIEMMDNTRAHAFLSRTATSKWYIIAWFNRTEKSVRFAFLDGGEGIPSTVYKKWRDKAYKVLEKIGLYNVPNDSRLIWSTLQGEFRTTTRQGYRGKGLPDIYKRYKDRFIGDLRVISNYGYIDCEMEKWPKLEDKFQGTLYTWKFL